MEIIVLGSGTSQGVPLIAHPNPGLDLKNPRNWRTRSSIHVSWEGVAIQVDAAPEFRLQCLREDIRKIDLFILTHGHADHLLGMDDLRRFCDLKQAALDVYATEEEGLKRIKAVFPYALNEKPEHFGYPAFRLHTMPERLELPGGCVYSTRLPHGKVEVLGLVFEEYKTGKRFAYYADCKSLPPAAKQLAQDVDLLIIDGLRREPHPTHLTIDEAIAAAHELEAKQTYLTHLASSVDHDTQSALLPAGVQLAYDGLRLVV